MLSVANLLKIFATTSETSDLSRGNIFVFIHFIRVFAVFNMLYFRLMDVINIHIVHFTPMMRTSESLNL